VCDELGACAAPPIFTPFTRCNVAGPIGRRDADFPFLLLLVVPLVGGARRRLR
jgi:hypothetical protein